MHVVLAGQVVHVIRCEQSGQEEKIYGKSACRNVDLGDLVLDGAVDDRTIWAKATVNHVVALIEHDGGVRHTPLDHQLLDRAHRMIGPMRT